MEPHNNIQPLMIAAAIENIITICAFAAIVILAPGLWKWASFACLLNINSIRFPSGKD